MLGCLSLFEQNTAVSIVISVTPQSRHKHSKRWEEKKYWYLPADACTSNLPSYVLLCPALCLQPGHLASLRLLKEQDKGLWDNRTPSYLLAHEQHSNCQKRLLKHWSFIISSSFLLVSVQVCSESQADGDYEEERTYCHTNGWIYLLAKQCAADTTQQVWIRLPPQKLSPIYIAAVQGWDPGRDEDPPIILGLRKLLFLCLLPHGLLVAAKLSTLSGTGGLLSLLAEI